MDESEAMTVATLHEFVRALRPGSPCFCCGGVLLPESAKNDQNDTEILILRCRRCGCEVRDLSGLEIERLSELCAGSAGKAA